MVNPMNENNQSINELNRANELYPNHKRRISRSREKMIILCRLIFGHGYTHINALRDALHVSRSRCQSNVTKWVADGVLREEYISGVGRLLGFGPAGAAFARAEMDISARVLHPMNLGRQGQRFAHAIAVQRAAADAARRDGLSLARVRCDFESLISHDETREDSHGAPMPVRTISMRSDALVHNTIIEVQLSRIAPAEMQKKIEAGAYLASEVMEKFYFYASRPSIFDEATILMQRYNGYQSGNFQVIKI